MPKPKCVLSHSEQLCFLVTHNDLKHILALEILKSNEIWQVATSKQGNNQPTNCTNAPTLQ